MLISRETQYHQNLLSFINIYYVRIQYFNLAKGSPRDGGECG